MALPADRWRLLVGGRGDPGHDPRYERELVRRFTGPNVSFLGLVEPDRFLGSIDILVVPSLWQENSPRVVYEAFDRELLLDGPFRATALKRYGEALRSGLAAETRALKARAEQAPR